MTVMATMQKIKYDATTSLAPSVVAVAAAFHGSEAGRLLCQARRF
jgi:hypothetical protein